MRHRFPLLTAVPLFALLLAATAPALAADHVARIENAGEALIFHPRLEAKGYSLTVSGPCGYRYEVSGRTGEIAFKLNEDTFDGAYNYTLVATPVVDRTVMRALREARESGDDRQVRRLCRDGKLPDAEKQTQSGSFLVLERRIIFDPTPEAARDSDRDGK